MLKKGVERMKKLLLGGSPCTFWSIAQTAHREIEAKGEGWELFKNYLIAKEKFKPDFFLYENNKSAAQPIKQQICRELGADLIYINSSLVSAQNRERFYVCNWPVSLPKERHIVLKDILEHGVSWKEKSYCLTASYSGAELLNTLERKQRTMIAEPIFDKPVRLGMFGTPSQTNRIYSINGKSCCICTGSSNGYVAYFADENREYPVYEVKDGKITVKNKVCKIKLPDGLYIIRKLTPVECERLQTLPDNYTAAVSNTRRYRALGNGWTAEVIIHLLKAGLKDISKDEPLVVLSMYDGIATGRYCLEQLGFKNILYFAYEVDKYAINIAESNYPDIIQMGNAFDVRKNEWRLNAQPYQSGIKIDFSI